MSRPDLRAEDSGVRKDEGRQNSGMRMINGTGSKLGAAARNARLSRCPEYTKARKNKTHEGRESLGQ